MLGHRADDVAGAQALARLAAGHKRPCTGEVERGDRFAAHQEEAVTPGQSLQRILQAVVDHPQQPWPERGGQHLGRELTPSPTRTPWVSSKICKSARWPCTRSTSPLR